MPPSFHPEGVDLAALARALRKAVGPQVEGVIVGRTIYLAIAET